MECGQGKKELEVVLFFINFFPPVSLFSANVKRVIDTMIAHDQSHRVLSYSAEFVGMVESGDTLITRGLFDFFSPLRSVCFFSFSSSSHWYACRSFNARH